jgi:hypothetical protein
MDPKTLSKSINHVLEGAVRGHKLTKPNKTNQKNFLSNSIHDVTKGPVRGRALICNPLDVLLLSWGHHICGRCRGMYVYMCMYVCVCMYVYIYIYIYIYIYRAWHSRWLSSTTPLPGGETWMFEFASQFGAVILYCACAAVSRALSLVLCHS